MGNFHINMLIWYGNNIVLYFMVYVGTYWNDICRCSGIQLGEFIEISSMGDHNSHVLGLEQGNIHQQSW